MPAFVSEQFHVVTSAEPERVWNALTATGFALPYLHSPAERVNEQARRFQDVLFCAHHC